MAEGHSHDVLAIVRTRPANWQVGKVQRLGPGPIAFLSSDPIALPPNVIDGRYLKNLSKLAVTFGRS